MSSNVTHAFTDYLSQILNGTPGLSKFIFFCTLVLQNWRTFRSQFCEDVALAVSNSSSQLLLVYGMIDESAHLLHLR